MHNCRCYDSATSLKMNAESLAVPKINIEFSDLEYAVPDPRKGTKIILKQIHGEFHGGQLNVILGPTGSGKTTLLKLLAGFKITQTHGAILINKSPRDFAEFHKICRFIPQEDCITPYLTIREYMLLAANLKFGSSLSAELKLNKIMEMLDTFHLANHQNTLVEHISGGERKRLSICLELLNSPAVLFLDEPTTGLDEYSAMHCLMQLKRLAQSGCTVICSIHAPSARLCQMFDKFYVLAEGECVYQGRQSNIVPYLNLLGLHCPLTYNPADFIIECANRDYGNYQRNMCDAIKNGQILNWTNNVEEESPTNELSNFHSRVVHGSCTTISYRNNCCSWWLQYKLLLMRMLLQVWRDKFMLKLKIFLYIFIAASVSVTYVGLGVSAVLAIFMYHFSFVTIVVFVFMSVTQMLARMPEEFKHLRKEYFNQWYDLSSYFIALLTAQLPEIFIMGTICSAMMYFISNQPVEMFRYGLYLLAIVLTAMASSSFGILVSSSMNLMNTLFISNACLAVFVIFANHTVGNPELSVLERFFVYTSYVRHSVQCVIAALFQFDREDSLCPNDEPVCIFKLRFVAKLVGFEKLNYSASAVILFGFYLMYNLLAYLLLRYRLRSSQHIVHKLKCFLLKYFHLSFTF